tara:strand:+ start:668 stop:1216 length:549 start_codon:yes stop_codon:yes gene_type:complete
MSILKVDTINEKTSGNGVAIPGHVIQVVNSIRNTAVSTTSSSFASVDNLSLNITPKSNTSKILVEVKLNNISVASGHLAMFRLVRDSTVIAGHSGSGIIGNNSAFAAGGGGGNSDSTYNGGDSRKINSGGVTFLDSPATTSSTNYKVEIASSNNGTTVYLNRWALNADVGAVSSITLMEIAQ